ncbi:Hsp20 family protein [Methyloligella halotolerans]|nr:Hsp20 family protein [Methyloligella halotolerans]
MTHLQGAVWFGSSRDGRPDQGKSSPQGRSSPRGNPRPDGYPPFNIELVPETADRPEALRITLAVAGFSREELQVTAGGGELVVEGRQSEAEDSVPREYLHRGIAARQFKRSFGLAHGVEVCEAELHNGLLTVELRRPRKAEPVRKVGIVSGGQD